MAIKIWKCMIENYDSDLEETGNRLVVELRDSDHGRSHCAFANKFCHIQCFLFSYLLHITNFILEYITVEKIHL